MLPQIKDYIRTTINSAHPYLVGAIRSDYSGFELLGFDFMIDDDLKLRLIECNTNPCLET